MYVDCPREWLKSSDGREWIQGYFANHPTVTRSGLSRVVCEHVGWQDRLGRGKEMSCRKALCELEARHQVVLPAARNLVPRKTKVSPPALPAFAGSLSELGHVEVLPITGSTQESRRWHALMDGYHPQGSGPLCGAQIRYLIVSGTQGVIGGLAVSAAAWRLAARDKWLGWDDSTRGEELSGIVCNSRFLIVPTVKVKNLGSHVLSRLARRLRQDWHTRYGYSPWLMETCVEASRAGTVYRAANWIEVGLTAGRGRQDSAGNGGLSRKRVFLYPLCPTTLKRLSAGGANLQSQIAPGWVHREFGGAELGDKRLERRLLELADAFFARPSANIPQACGSLAKAKAAYRFFDHPEVTMKKLLEPHFKSTRERAGHEAVVLAVEDTTSLDYTTHRTMQGLGPIHNRVHGPQGLMLHSTQAFRPDGLPLGLLDVDVWARDAAQYAEPRDQSLPIEKKESYKWIKALDGIKQASGQCPDTEFVVVADREADIFEFMDASREKGLPFLVRAKTNRHLLETEGRLPVQPGSAPQAKRLLWDVMEATREAGQVDLTVPRRGSAPARLARMSVRFAKVTLKPPKLHPDLPPIELWAIWTKEIGGSTGTTRVDETPEDAAAEDASSKPLAWMLLTSRPVLCLQDALERIQWYTRRWGIEVFHRILKSGCCIEDRQLGNDDRLEACLAIDLVVAWRIHHLTTLGRATPDVPCTVAFSDSQWKAVLAVRTRQIPSTPPTLREMLRHVASLGGFLGRKSDGEPGTQTLWRGLQRMHDFVLAFDLVLEMQQAKPTNPTKTKPPNQKKTRK